MTIVRNGLFLYGLLTFHRHSFLQMMDESVASINGGKSVPSVIVARGNRKIGRINNDTRPSGIDGASSGGDSKVADELQSLSTSIATLANNTITVAGWRTAEEPKGESEKNRVHDMVRQLRDSLERVKEKSGN